MHVHVHVLVSLKKYVAKAVYQFPAAKGICREKSLLMNGGLRVYTAVAVHANAHAPLAANV